MSWQDQLISVYLFVCKHYEGQLSLYSGRMSNYSNLHFSDEEAISLYLYGIMEGHRTLKSIHRYARKHLMVWFPSLPNYVAFDQRINQLHDVFLPLAELIGNELRHPFEQTAVTGLIDSMPIVMAQRGRRFNAKVAPQIATNNGYCATKKLFYYGVKLHVLGYRISGKLPCPAYIGLTDAGTADRKAFEQIVPELPSNMTHCFADKAYQIGNQPLDETQAVTLLTPPKKKKGQAHVDAFDKWLSTAVASVRQPIESLFNWLNEKTGIQMASKVRSYKGLMVHVFGRLAAALFMMQNPTWAKIDF